MDSSSINTARSYLDFDGLGQLKGQARQDAKSAMRETAQQFEALFLQQMMKSMRATIDKSEISESNSVETFENMFDKEVALKMAKRGDTGLADMLVKSMETQQAQVQDNAKLLQDLEQKNTTARAFALNPKVTGMPLLDAAAPAKAMPLRELGVLPLNLPPKPLGSD
jgi:Rod binding domain-containing protein